MSGINKVILVGRLGQDAQVNQLQDGSVVSNVSIATSRNYRDDNGQRQEDTEWHRLVFWNALAKVIGEYGLKGAQIYVEGSLRTRSYKDTDDRDVYVTEVMVKELKLLGNKPDA